MIHLENALTSLLLLLLATTVTSQTGSSIIPPSEPACINQCTIFVQAIQACAPDSNVQAQYTSCFCQSAYLTPIQGSSSNLCAPQCSDADFGTIASWYKGFCANGGAPPATTAIPATTLITITTTPPPSTTPTSSAPPQGATNVNQGNGANPDDSDDWTDAPGWFRTHWQWVVMLIVLFVAFLLLGVGGSIWYRRYKRHREYGDSTAPTAPHVAASHPEISQWAPSQHSVHDFGAGPGPAPARQGTTESGSPVSAPSMGDNGLISGNGKGKGKEVDRTENRAQSPPPAAMPGRIPSRRLTKTPTGSAR